MVDSAVRDEQYIERLRAKVDAYEAIRSNGKTAAQNCIETGICVHALKNPSFSGRDWFFVAKCTECVVFNCEYNPAAQ